MIKILFKLLSILILVTPSVLAEIITNINVEGNQRISKETIVVLGDIKLNQNFDNIKLNDTLKKLYETNFFGNISLSVNNGVLKINVTENPIIENIEINGIKDKKILENINDQIFLKNRMSFTENLLNKDIELIKNVHKSAGYYFVKVTPSVSKDEKLNSIRLAIDIDSGKKAKIKKILFIGDKKIKDKKLLEIIASEEHKFWKIISQRVYLNQSIINLDKRLLENYYKNRGYYNVKILDSYAELNNEDSFNLVFNVEAGEKYYFNDFNLLLPEDYEEKDFDKVKKLFSKLKNKKYSIDSLEKILNEIEIIASQNLYDFIDASVNEKIVEKNKINFDFKIKDSQKYYVERVNIFGNFNTLEEVIRNKLIVDEGDPLNELLYNKSIDEIRSTGFFKNVKAEIVDGSSSNEKIININVEEQATGEISMGAGYGTSGSMIGGGITEKNFLGKGINLDTNFEISEQSVKGKFIYSKPNFNYSDNTLFTSIRATTTDNLTDFGYKTSDTGFSIATKFEQYENLYFRPEIDLSSEKIETNSTATESLKKQEGTYSDIYFNYSLDHDLRNSSFNPSSGYKTSFYQTLPLISENNEIANTFVTTHYKTLNQNSGMIGKTSFYFKTVHSISDDDVRISKRASIPYKRLRGFKKGAIGPVDDDDFVGGNYASSVNFSTTLPGFFRTVENVDMSYFIDAGNVWGVDYSDTIDDSNFIRSSTGVSLDLLTPVGPLSFSWTQPITKKSSDKTETFRFNLGTTF
tara:strand:+ start:126 stop:2375 length:2250 start_codon:yes stop_codon:yes gene_type:complete